MQQLGIRAKWPSHSKRFLELESVTSPNNIKALGRLYDQVEFQVRSLEVPLNSYDNFLSYLFMNRLPQKLHLIIVDEEWYIDEIMIIVEREISAPERAFSSTSGVAWVRIAHSCSIADYSDSQPKCSYYQQGFSSSSCTIVTDVAQRKAILKRSGRCFGLLSMD